MDIQPKTTMFTMLILIPKDELCTHNNSTKAVISGFKRWESCQAICIFFKADTDVNNQSMLRNGKHNNFIKVTISQSNGRKPAKLNILYKAEKF